MKPLSTFAALLAAVVLFVNVPTVAQEKGKTAAAELTADSERALAALVAKVPLAKSLQPKATAILVFPSVKKAGLGIGGQYGEGTLLKGGSAAAFYKTTGASVGLQAGAQQYGYALFLMNHLPATRGAPAGHHAGAGRRPGGNCPGGVESAPGGTWAAAPRRCRSGNSRRASTASAGRTSSNRAPASSTSSSSDPR